MGNGQVWMIYIQVPKVKSLIEKSNALVLRAKEGLKGKHASKGTKLVPAPSESQFSFTTGRRLSGVSLNFQVDKPTANHMHVESKGHSTVSHNFHVYTKNVRLHNDERLAEVLAEVSSMQWDIIISSETRRSHDTV